MNIKGEEVLTKQQVMDELNIAKRTLNLIMQRGQLTYLKMGPHDRSPVRIRRSDLDAFIERSTRNKQPA